MTDKPGFRRDDLLRELMEATSASDAVRKQAQSLVETTSISGSMAQNLVTIVRAAPNDSVLSPQEWDGLRQEWHSYNMRLGKVFVAASDAQAVTATGQAAALTTTMASQRFEAWIGPAEKTALAELGATLHRPGIVDDAIGFITRLKLAGDATHRSPSDLLREAHLSLSRPPEGEPVPSAVLLGVREAANRVIALLLQRRPVQDRARKASDKISSIGHHLGLDELDRDHFARLGSQWDVLVARLSESKQEPLAAEEVRSRFDQAVHFINALLTSLDAAKAVR